MKALTGLTRALVVLVATAGLLGSAGAPAALARDVDQVTVNPSESSVTPMVVDPGRTKRCTDGGTGGIFNAHPANFGQAQKILNAGMPYRSSTQVWQADNNNEVWIYWCWLTDYTGSVAGIDGTNPVVRPAKYYLSDGTLIMFRPTSKSGGYTVDIKSPYNSKPYKIHVA